MDSNKIGKFIYTLRKEKNLSQYQLADMIPISRQAVSKWERGITIPDSSTLLRLSEIFEVTINELLNGKRLEENSIEELESTTLEIIDQHNIKKKKDKRIITLLGTIIFILTFSFLLYYFITSYSSIKVYKVSGTNETIDLYNGLFIITKEKAYLKIGKIKNRSDEISNINLYYIKNKETKYISYDVDIDEIIIINRGYKESASIEDIEYIIKNTYIEIDKKNKAKETIHLSFERDFINNKFLLTYKSKIINKEKSTINIENNDINITEVVLLIKEKGEYKNNSYSYTLKNSSEKITFIFFEDIELLRIINYKNEYIDYHFNTKTYQCNLEKNKSRDLNCKKQLLKYNDMLFNDGT